MPTNNFIDVISNNPLVNQEVYSLPDDQFYDHFNFNQSIESWSDFLQPKFPTNSINEIKQIDLESQHMNNYLLGMDFFRENKGFKSFYLEHFEENFRKQLENSDLLDKLFFTVDFNSVWGGIFTNVFSEVVIQEMPKTTKIIQAIDDDNIFRTTDENNPKIKLFNNKKILNYFYFYTDLLETDQTLILAPIKNKENISFFEDLFNFRSKGDSCSEGAANFYTSSLLGLDNINMLIPLLGKSKNAKNNNPNSKFIDSLLQNNYINFYHSDISFDLMNENTYKNKTKFTNNGLLFTYNTNLIEKDEPHMFNKFNWDRHFSFTSRFKHSNFSITHGYNDKLRLITSPIDKFLGLTSNLNYSNIEPIPIPFCFPRNLYYDNKKKFIDNASMISIYSHDYLYCNNFLSTMPKYITDQNFQVEKYLRKIDVSKYLELSDRVEELYKIIDFYDTYKSPSYAESDDE
jgi:hypothetical protein